MYYVWYECYVHYDCHVFVRCIVLITFSGCLTIAMWGVYNYCDISSIISCFRIGYFVHSHSLFALFLGNNYLSIYYNMYSMYNMIVMYVKASETVM